jgi:cardiolipin synthase (CMP-forming)
MSRIFAVPILVFLLWPGTKPFGVQPVPLDYAFAFILYCLMGITDYFDGYLARAQGTVSKLGVFLDPIADKIMVAAVVLMLVFTRDVDGWHVIAALVILLREMIVSGLREFPCRSSRNGRQHFNSCRLGASYWPDRCPIGYCLSKRRWRCCGLQRC